MQKLSLIFSMILLFGIVSAQQSPHGDKLAFSCTDCHTTEGWKFSQATAKFSHDLTTFKLEGQHFYTDCAACHKTLVFSEAKSNCVDCHTDMHNNTVGPNCAECHTPKSWIVNNITEIHQNSRFPLLGAHNTADCSACHTSVSKLEFQPLGIECYDCHRSDYQAATNPNHVQSGFSTNCFECHRIDAFEWSASGINHDFFPLTKGHAIENCADCHTSGISVQISANCYDCHQKDYNSAINPSHQNSGFSTSCTECHTTDPSWKPAEFRQHDALYFPVYSGSHRGEWNSCAECHTQPESYNSFSCIDCHEHNKSDMDKEHRGENGYSYNSNACFACHPNGNEEGAFNHNSTAFPLKGAHAQTGCIECHSNGYAGTSMLCSSCHTNKYNEAVNPNHVNAGISNECEVCHTEENWVPSNFNHTTTTGFELTNGHSGKQCSECHKGTTTEASSDCISCHQANYNEAENHVAQNFPKECLQCHTTVSWDGADFDHNKTAFPLTGSHVATECSACHTNGYEGTSTLCSACHIEKYNTAQNPNHTAAGISNECETCHQTTAWVPSNFNHTTTTGFELTNGHSGKQCSECHKGTTTEASSDCISCHQANYNEAENHVAQNFPKECLQCHTTVSWDGADFDHNKTAFPLTGSHVATECSACHTNGYEGTSTLCSACHIEKYNTAQNPNHTAAGISNECETCHQTTAWVPSNFNHTTTTGFELTNGHSGKQCSECHKGTTTEASSDCISCHQANYNEAENHVAQNFPKECLQCHTTVSWDGADFDHNKTAFPLTGSHVATECSACHTNGYEGTSMLCSACHIEKYNTAQNPNHTAAGISNQCETCHQTTAWVPSNFNHTTTTGFELTNGHSGKQCSECHKGTTTEASSDCISCHQANYNEAENHVAQNFPKECLQCHTTVSWDGADFDHNKTAFPLTGSHVATECSACHTNGYEGTSTLCSACHIEKYNTAQNPNHTAAGISNQCETCHQTTAWVPSNFNHTTTTGFELTNGHSGKQCSECHKGTTTEASSDCISCHQANYNEAENHVAQNFPKECLQCHTTVSWDGADFDHNKTAFPLTGSHVATECSACHTNGYEGTSTLCSACHIEKYNTAQNPNHTAAGISNECETCHQTTAWVPSNFNHTTTTGFELTNGHSGKQCSECHKGTTTEASSDCISCHQANYNEAENHVAQNFPKECLQCHNTSNWDDYNFDHNATNFPLTGSHIATECSACHTSGYAGTSTLCNSCHSKNYNESVNPNHSSLAISTNCEECHTTGPGWDPALFPTHNDYYALNGAHATVSGNCFLCHNGNYTNTPNTCYACHTSDYNNTKDPAHATAQFSTDCKSCHTENAWEPSTFDHDNQYFPIYSGEHRGEWNSCVDCHTQPTNFSVFSCIDCHEHNKTEMDSEHRGESGYVYASINCFACHPKGKADD